MPRDILVLGCLSECSMPALLLLLCGKSTQSPSSDETPRLPQPHPRYEQDTGRISFPWLHTARFWYWHGQGLALLPRGHCQSTWHLLPLCCDTSVLMSPHPCSMVGISCSTGPIPCNKASLSSSLSAKPSLSSHQNLSCRAGSACISFPLSPDVESYCKRHYLPHLPKQCVSGEDAGSMIQSFQSLFHLPGI